LAAVQIAQRLGAEVWATAGTLEKRAYLQSLGVQHVMDSRSLAFAAEIMAATDGQGVDVVLNSLTGAAVEKSLEVLGRYGRFVEIGKKDIYEKRALSLHPFQRALSYFAVDLAGLTVHRPAECAHLFQSVMCQVNAGDIQPVPVQTFEIAEAVEAFRYMAQGKHTGKIAITVTDRARVPIVVRRTEEQGRIRPDGSYLITGGLGGLGLKVAEWLIQRGARDVVLVGRRGASEETERLLATWRVPGVRVEAVAADVSQSAEVARLLNIVRTQHGPLRGIIHAAGILDDGVLLKQTADRFERVLGPKAYSAWLLHQQTLTDELDFFVLFSSAASLLGSPGQGNYAAANAFLDGLAQHRVAQGLPGLSINWGAWSEVGMAAAQAQRGERIAQNGLGSLSPAEGLTALEYVLQQVTGQIGVMALNVRQWRQVYPRAAQLPMLAELFAATAREGVPTKTTGQLCQTLSNLPADQRSAALERYLREELAKVLRLKIDRIGRDAPLQGLGLDSLMALELRNRLEDNLGLQLTATLIWAHPTVSALASYLLTQLGLQVEIPPTPEPAAPQFSAEEGDAILKKLAALKQAMN
jgi:NADPH:quinone reductase-like Zn-dependent oxidoreductase/acyl carrier protein